MPERVVVIASLAESLLNFRGPLLRELVAQGHEVIALAPESSAVREQLAGIGVRMEAVPLGRTGLNPLRDLMLTLCLVRAFRRIRPTCILAYTIKPVVYGGIAARLAGVRGFSALVTGLGYAFTEGVGLQRRLVGGMAEFLYRLALRKARIVFFQNPDDRDFFTRLGLVRPQQAVLVNGSGVDLGHYALQPPPSQDGFLMIARLVRDKGVVEYVAAARLVKQRFPDTRFVLAGWLDSNPTAIGRRQLEEWIAEGVIEFAGELADVRPALAACSVYVLPSYREGTPRTVLEAMATGRAIITTDAPGCRETIVDGESGYLVRPKDIAALAAAMTRFLESPGLSDRMGVAARERAQRKYDVHGVNEVIMTALQLQRSVGAGK